MVLHTYREANQCADVLANMRRNMDDGCVYFDFCPSNISRLLLVDVLGTATPRMILLYLVFRWPWTLFFQQTNKKRLRAI
jgi:hypothetical protein